MNICRTQFNNQVPIIQETFIEAFSLFKYFSDNFKEVIPEEVKVIISEGLLELQEQIRLSIDLFIEGGKEFCQSKSIDYELRKSEYAFSLVLSDYVVSMQRMGKTISSLLETYK